MIKIPAISGGGPTDRFKKVFWDAVTEKDPKSGLPMKGSIGVHWNVYADLGSLNTDGQLLTNLCKLRVNKLNPRSVKSDDPFLTKISAGFLAKFYEFANQQTQPYFFIKNGASPLWLAKNVGTYEYDGTHEFPHRIRYEIVRVVTEGEGRQRLGDGNKALFMMAPESLPLDVAMSQHATTESNLETPVSAETMSSTTVATKPKRQTKKKLDTNDTTIATTATTATVTNENVQANTIIVPKKGRPKKTVEPVKVVAVDTPKVVSIEPKKERKQKTVNKISKISPLTTLVAPPILIPEHIETNDEPLSVDSVELIKLTSFDIDGTGFYREPIKNKLFKQNKDGSIGPYVGRWSTKEAKIYEDIPDSDRE